MPFFACNTQDEPPKIGRDSNRPNIQPLDIKTLNKTELASRNQAIRKQPMILDDDSDDEDDEFDEKKITVPLTVTMVVIAGYIFGGAVLFGLWEGERHSDYVTGNSVSSKMFAELTFR